MLMLTLDIGSTCLKAQVFDEKGNILFYRAAECALAEFDGTQTADIDAITETVALLTREAAKAGEICSVAISSFGESFVALDENDSILYAPMLYTDKRGGREAEILSEMFGKDKLFSVTGTLPAAMYSISKLLWLKNNRSEIFRRTKKMVGSIVRIQFRIFPGKPSETAFPGFQQKNTISPYVKRELPRFTTYRSRIARKQPNARRYPHPESINTLYERHRIYQIIN